MMQMLQKQPGRPHPQPPRVPRPLLANPHLPGRPRPPGRPQRLHALSEAKPIRPPPAPRIRQRTTPFMASTSDDRLPFEAPIYEMEVRLTEMEALYARTRAGEEAPKTQAAAQIRGLRRELANLKRTIYANLEPWQTVMVSRHRNRPQTRDYIELIFDQFVELHGDRAIGDDQAVVTGLAHARRDEGDVHRPPEGEDDRRAERVQLRLRPPRGLPQGPGQDAAGGQVRPADRQLHRHPGRLPGHRRRGARPGRHHRREPDGDEPGRHPDRLRRHRRRGVRGGPGDRHRRPPGHARARLLLGHQPRRVRHHPLEVERALAPGRRGAEDDQPRPAPLRRSSTR